jgi:hypothetical protein
MQDDRVYFVGVGDVSSQGSSSRLHGYVSSPAMICNPDILHCRNLATSV